MKHFPSPTIMYVSTCLSPAITPLSQTDLGCLPGTYAVAFSSHSPENKVKCSWVEIRTDRLLAHCHHRQNRLRLIYCKVKEKQWNKTKSSFLSFPSYQAQLHCQLLPLSGTWGMGMVSVLSPLQLLSAAPSSSYFSPVSRASPCHGHQSCGQTCYTMGCPWEAIHISPPQQSVSSSSALDVPSAVSFCGSGFVLIQFDFVFYLFLNSFLRGTTILAVGHSHALDFD